MTEPSEPVQTSSGPTAVQGRSVPGLGCTPKPQPSRNCPAGVLEAYSDAAPTPSAPIRALGNWATRKYRPSACRCQASTVAQVVVEFVAKTVTTCPEVVAAAAAVPGASPTRAPSAKAAASPIADSLLRIVRPARPARCLAP